MVHLGRPETTITKTSDHRGIGGPVLQIANTGSPSVTRDTEDRHPVGTVDPDKLIDHLQKQLIPGPRAKRTAHPGKVVLCVGKETVKLLSIAEIHVPSDHFLSPVYPLVDTLWRNLDVSSV